MSMHADPLETFRDEAQELLAALEQNLLALEENPSDHEMIGAAFRNLHTLKGSAGMFGMDVLVALAHQVESVFALVRDGKEQASQGLLSLSFQAKDILAELLTTHPPAEDIRQRAAELQAAFAVYDPAGKGPSGKAGANTDETPSTGSTREARPERTWRIHIAPQPRFLRHGNNPLLLLQELTDLGTSLVMGFSDQVPPLEKLDPQVCYLTWHVLLTTTATEQELKDIFIFVGDDALVEFTLVDDMGEADIPYKRLGEILLERGDIDTASLEAAISERAFLGEKLVEQGFVSPERVQSALEEQRYVQKNRESRRSAEAGSSIRVNTDKLGALVNLVGEFVALQAHLAHTAEASEDDTFLQMSEQMNRLVRELRTTAIEMRMVPIQLLFSGFLRLVRDLSRELKKEVSLVTKGGETELDKTVIDLLKDPLMHIIRNSLDHGIETPEERRSRGKPPGGTVTLSAAYAGAQVLITIADDGGGMDADRIRAKAEQKGLLEPGQDYRQEEILQCIFAPGFSTAEQATNVSGRGVGMDVVQKNLEQLSGSVRVTSVPGKGSTITLRIPLTLAIVEGLLAGIGNNLYLINLSYIERCLDLAEIPRRKGEMFFDYNGEILALLDLREYFRLTTDQPPPHRHVVVVSAGTQRIGLVVDALHDTYQSVIKPLGSLYEGVEGVGGAIILGDGTPALVLDVDRLVRLTEQPSPA
ncbi:two-component system, chemotaxis family, sensor kinase CheA [Alkalispirochaeta americana]|uniref:Chemotaxis protein CheA n=1 Tax=Alkalispirochaeta americana TaxID=159291 RepID=A0A1N6UUV0_9SPIO|nr:chemotaxis protein CheA [Alkalispirochaeta americana]SIQ69425.1 two-component system, chemotaxis family, sensor kinase CheA [Alkalispirochaeta americana]